MDDILKLAIDNPNSILMQLILHPTFISI